MRRRSAAVGASAAAAGSVALALLSGGRQRGAPLLSGGDRLRQRRPHPRAAAEHLHAGLAELLRPQGGGAAADHHAAAVGRQTPRQLARLALGLGGHAAAQQHAQVGLVATRHHTAAGGGKLRRRRLTVGLTHLAAHERRVHARHLATGVIAAPVSSRHQMDQRPLVQRPPLGLTERRKSRHGLVGLIVQQPRQQHVLGPPGPRLRAASASAARQPPRPRSSRLGATSPSPRMPPRSRLATTALVSGSGSAGSHTSPTMNVGSRPLRAALCSATSTACSSTSRAYTGPWPRAQRRQGQHARPRAHVEQRAARQRAQRLQALPRGRVARPCRRPCRRR